ncbi:MULTISPECIES: hypothetical protein [Exiguobacterium]|uniref:Uncharacterized protein n=1 Tax=Exiguobacterium sibiricum (strain DSM 17290 / CCUG 55495 / CIP 109462 / JCM 13490 / 255-15) TaxID=262543 RepID=B1YJK7_EXIS2|nr:MULTISPECIES: hypothetical protein [Exiguobacterium]ACB60037.1 hypothetical protein Exig_0556 [Exiguobacterium sibiricum 255-15]MDX1260431.1 hypothetical protein [Exiguobacterium sp. K1]
MKRFVKNEAIAPALNAFLTLENEAFQTYNQLLTAQERQALNFVGRAVALQSDKHLALALETKQPLIEMDRLLMKLTEIEQGALLFRQLLASGLDLNQLITVEGHRSLVRQPLSFPVGLYTVYDHVLFQLAVDSGLDLNYTTTLQRSDRFLETDEINTLDIVLLLTHEQAPDEQSLPLFQHPATVGLAERLQRAKFESLQSIIENTRYVTTFRYAKHFPLFYAIVGRQTEQFPKMLDAVLMEQNQEEILKDALLAFHNHQPGLATSMGTDYYESLFVIGDHLKRQAGIDFNTLDDQYILSEYSEIVQRLRS